MNCVKRALGKSTLDHRLDVTRVVHMCSNIRWFTHVCPNAGGMYHVILTRNLPGIKVFRTSCRLGKCQELGAGYTSVFIFHERPKEQMKTPISVNIAHVSLSACRSVVFLIFKKKCYWRDVMQMCRCSLSRWSRIENIKEWKIKRI